MLRLLPALLLAACLSGGIAYVPDDYYVCEGAALQVPMCEQYYYWVPPHWTWPYNYWQPGHYVVRGGWHRRPPRVTYPPQPYPAVRDHRQARPRDHRR